MKELFRAIPQVTKIIEDDRVRQYLSCFYMSEIKDIIDSCLTKMRKDISNNSIKKLDYEICLRNILDQLDSENPYSLRKVVNGTGTVLHTNLGRALLSKNVLKNIENVCSGYSNLEYESATGNRGSRHSHLENLICKITGAESALVVNNNAAAILLAINVFSKDKEVIISRGELIEIGGSFRIPNIIETSGAILKEVGTTNRTHLQDYENATNENTRIYLKVHPSNYRIQGFSKEVEREQLVKLAKEKNILTIEDLGSGALVDLSKFNLVKEATVMDSLNSGMDIVTFSGDKLLGGPQAGIIVGKKELISKIKDTQLARAFRVGKLTIAALEATFRDYLDTNSINELPVYKMFNYQLSELKEKAQNLAEKLNAIDGIEAKIIEISSTPGGGSLPNVKIPSYGVAVESNKFSESEMSEFLRNGKISIIGINKNMNYYLDVRTLLEEDYQVVIDRMKEL